MARCRFIWSMSACSTPNNCAKRFDRAAAAVGLKPLGSRLPGHRYSAKLENPDLRERIVGWPRNPEASSVAFPGLEGGKFLYKSAATESGNAAVAALRNCGDSTCTGPGLDVKNRSPW